MNIPRGMFSATAPAHPVGLLFWLELAITCVMYLRYMQVGLRAYVRWYNES